MRDTRANSARPQTQARQAAAKTDKPKVKLCQHISETRVGSRSRFQRGYTLVAPQPPRLRCQQGHSTGDVRAEFINDRGRDVYNLFRALQEHDVAFLDMLRFQITK